MPQVKKISMDEIKSAVTHEKRGRKPVTYKNYVYEYTDKNTGAVVRFNTSIAPQYMIAYGPHGETCKQVTTNQLPLNQ